MNIMYCRHLLIKHTQSRNPSSWREKTITRTKEQAIIKLQQIRKEIVENGQDFIRLTMIESDCASAKYGGYLTGDINHFQKAFTDAYLKLKPHEISDIVETESGVHIILRLEEGEQP